MAAQWNRPAEKARKSLIFTSAISIVLAANEQSGVSWAVQLAGWKAWLFLGMAHAYFIAMWRADGGLEGLWKYMRWNNLKLWFRRFGGSKTHWDEIVFYAVTNYLALIGAIIIIWNLVGALFSEPLYASYGW